MAPNILSGILLMTLFYKSYCPLHFECLSDFNTNLTLSQSRTSSFNQETFNQKLFKKPKAQKVHAAHVAVLLQMNSNSNCEQVTVSLFFPWFHKNGDSHAIEWLSLTSNLPVQHIYALQTGPLH